MTSAPPPWRLATPAFEEARRNARAAATRFQLPFRRHSWRGNAGNWMGAGIGSSIDFQDHRPYVPGDDPRYINWQAYARTGHPTMKLYREEVSPRVDLAFDTSASMAVTEAKGRRALELAFFVAECGRAAGASLRLWLIGAGTARPCLPDALPRALADAPAGGRPVAPDLESLPWRAGSLRVLISDLLFPGEPQPVLRPLLSRHGLAILLAPFDLAAEASPSWSGNFRFVDCESQSARDQRVEPHLLTRYQAAYQRHFGLWKDESRRLGAALGRVNSHEPLAAALQAEAVPAGAVELAAAG